MEARTSPHSPRKVFDLRTERINAGYSQRQLATELGIHREAIRRVEEGTGHITPSNAKAIGDRFGVTAVEVLAACEPLEDAA